METTYMEELRSIQKELEAPKGQYNKFGKFYYRSCEDILGAVKPLLEKHGCNLLLSDKPVEIGGRVYIEAKAILINKDGKKVKATSYAREQETKKGMDEAQITGSTSSYARKYALNGLFAIDDAKDPDTRDNSKDDTPVEKKTEDDDKPRFGDEDFEKWKSSEKEDKPKTPFEMRKHFKVSKKMAKKIEEHVKNSE